MLTTKLIVAALLGALTLTLSACAVDPSSSPSDPTSASAIASAPVSPPVSPSVSGACSSDNLQVTASRPAAGVAAEGTVLVFEVLTITNIGPECTVDSLPTLDVATATGDFVAVPVTLIDVAGAGSITVPRGSIEMTVGQTWPLPSPAGRDTCANPIADVTRLRIPLKGSDAVPVTLSRTWLEVCASAPTTTLGVATV